MDSTATTTTMVINQLSEYVSTTIQNGGSLFITGEYGTGKVETVRSEIIKAGFEFLYMDLSKAVESDLAALCDLKSDNVVALLDRVNEADESVSNLLPELAKLRSVNGTKSNLKAVIMTAYPKKGTIKMVLSLIDSVDKTINVTHEACTVI